MDRRIVALVVAVAPLACTHNTPQGTDTTSAGTDGSGEDTDGSGEDTDWNPYDDQECTGSSYGTGVVFTYSEASIRDPLDPETPLWIAPRDECELSTIVDFDIADDGSFYAISTAFIHRDACEGMCPWRYWLRRISAAGREEWARAFTYPAFELRSVRALGDVGVVVGGAANTNDGRFPWVARLDAAGEMLWEDIFAEPGQVNAVARGPDDRIVAAGNLEFGGAEELWVAQMSAEGALGWTFALADDLDDAGLAVAVDDAGRAWIAGGRDPWWTGEDIGYYTEGKYAWWYGSPETFRFDVNVDDPFVALLDEHGALLWLDETDAVGDALRSSGVGIDLLPGGDAIVGVSWHNEPQKWFARYAADGSRAWETLVTPPVADPDDAYLDEVVCDSLGRSHVLTGGVIVQLDDAGEVIGMLGPEIASDQIALDPADAVWASYTRIDGVLIDTWDATTG